MASSLVPLLLERTAAVRAPLAGESPVGVDLSFDTEFEKIKGEVDKLTGISGATPNWKLVIQEGDKLLKTRTKDIRVAVWVLVAKMQCEAWLGFAEGLVALRGLVADFWDAIYPDAKRIRARANLVGWLNENANAFLADRSVLETEYEAVRSAHSLLEELDGLLAANLGGEYLGLGSLRATLRNKVAELPAVEDTGAADARDETTSGLDADAPQTHAPTATVSDVSRSLRTAGNALVSAARALRRLEPGDPWSYRLNRLGAWLSIELPPATDEFKTPIAPPREELQKKLVALQGALRWSDLVMLVEQETQSYPFWLDLQRLAAHALDRLGVLFFATRESLGREVVDFARRFPTIVSLKFSDGTAFADDETKRWLREEQARYAPSAAWMVAKADSDDQSARVENARSMVAQGDVTEGLQLVAHAFSRSADGKERFQARITMIELALLAKKPEIYNSQLTELSAAIERHHLDEWEPKLCARAIYAYLSCRVVGGWNTAQSADPEATLYQKLCRLEPALALRLAEKL